MSLFEMIKLVEGCTHRSDHTISNFKFVPILVQITSEMDWTERKYIRLDGIYPKHISRLREHIGELVNWHLRERSGIRHGVQDPNIDA